MLCDCGCENVDLDLDEDEDEIDYAAVVQRVKNGARWLDENFPGWESRIDPDTLDLISDQNCICGQVFKRDAKDAQGTISMPSPSGYWFAERTLFSEANSWINFPKKAGGGYDAERAEKVSVFLGFNTTTSDSDEWDLLQSAWTDLLHERANV